MYYLFRRTLLVNINAIACVKAEIQSIAPMLKNIYKLLLHYVESHRHCNIYASCIYECKQNIAAQY